MTKNKCNIIKTDDKTVLELMCESLKKEQIVLYFKIINK